MTDPIQLVEQVKNSMEKINASHTTLTDMVKGFSADIENGKKINADALKAANDAASEVQKLADRIIHAEQKLADNVQSGKTEVKTLGQLVIASDAYKDFASGVTSRGRFEVQANTITGTEGSPPANSDVLVPAQRLGGIIPGAFRALKIRDLLAQGNTTSNMVEYTRENVFTNGAAETAENNTKPEATLTFDLKTAPVRTIAHFIKLTKQVLEDAPALASYVDTRLRYGVELRIDQQILNGNGTGQNISGLTDKDGTTDNYTAFSPTVGETELDALNRMKYLVAAQDYNATAIVLNPATWGAIERLKDTQDRYVIGSPLNPYGASLWGLPVVVTNTMAQGKALVAAFDILAQVWNRSGTVVEMFEQDDTNVQKNLVTVRAETRLALAIYRPASSQYGALTAPGASA